MFRTKKSRNNKRKRVKEMITELEQKFYDTFGIEKPDEIILIAFISAIKDDIKTVQDYKENKDAVLRNMIENKELFPYVKQGYEQVKDIMNIVLKTIGDNNDR